MDGGGGAVSSLIFLVRAGISFSLSLPPKNLVPLNAYLAHQIQNLCRQGGAAPLHPQILKVNGKGRKFVAPLIQYPPCDYQKSYIFMN